ncbi:MAG: YkvA family protein [Candidatus Sericytochromatia bacterium]|nr:YkvA family protein [Candidatus Sericytochromatia bacterium]
MPTIDTAQFFALLRRALRVIPFAREVLSMYYALLDPRTPTWVKATVVGAIAYFISPVDAIPDLVPMLGFTDDASLVFGAYQAVSAHISDDHRLQADDWLEKNA